MSLTVDTRFRRNGFHLEAAFDVEPGGSLAVVGPNGAGKTTLLRVLAGLEPDADGVITVGAVSWQAAGLFLPPESRRVGVVFQEALLFPHLSVRENVAFGAPSAQEVDGWIERLDLKALVDRKAGALSGGEATRTAVARALARAPEVLLLDEPFSDIDVGAVSGLRRMLRDAVAASGATVVVVTHSIVDAAALAEQVLVLEHGRVVQQGTVRELSRRPRSPFVADLVGTNLYSGQAKDGVIEVLPRGELFTGVDAAGPVMVSIHPRAVALYRSRPDGSPRNVWPATVAEIVALPDRARVRLEGQIPVVAEVTHAAAGETTVGEDIWVAIKASELTVYPA